MKPNAVPGRQMVLTCRAVLAIALLAFSIGITRLAAHAQAALLFPYAFDYGEGVVWQQMRDIVAGVAYQPISLDRAVAYQYPPLYHLVTAFVAKVSGFDELISGRLVSLICTVMSAVLIGWLTFRASDSNSRYTKLGAAVVAALAFVTLPLFNDWALMMRIDTLACLLTVAGMLLASRAPQSLTATIAAGLVFTAAMYTRQTSLPAPAAAFAVLLVISPRRAWLMASVATFSGLAALSALQWMTDGGFLLNIVGYNVNRIIWDHANALLVVLLSYVVLISLAGIGIATVLQPNAFRSKDMMHQWLTKNVTLAIVLTMLTIKTLMLPMILKSGASDNYLIDWFIGICVLAGLAAIPLIETALSQSDKAPAPTLALFSVGLLIYLAAAPAWPDQAALDIQRRGLDAVVAQIAASDRPVLTDDAVLLIRAGKREQWEMGMIAEMGALGRFDEKGFADKIRRGEFGFVVTQGDRGDMLFDQRFNAVMVDAIHAAFPRREIIGGRVMHLPAYNPAAIPPKLAKLRKNFVTQVKE